MTENSERELATGNARETSVPSVNVIRKEMLVFSTAVKSE